NRIFQLSERALNRPSGSIELFDTLRRKFIVRQIGNNAFIRIFGNRESYDAEGQVIGIERSINQIVKRSVDINISSVKPFFDWNFSFMAAYKRYIYGKIKRVLVREVKVFYNALRMNILCTEQEVLSFFDNMCHVVIRAVSSVS